MKETKILVWLTIPLLLLLVTVSGTGIFLPGFYAAESRNWLIQSIGQDYIDLLLNTAVQRIFQRFGGA